MSEKTKKTSKTQTHRASRSITRYKSGKTLYSIFVPGILRGIYAYGFEKPSPIQKRGLYPD